MVIRFDCLGDFARRAAQVPAATLRANEAFLTGVPSRENRTDRAIWKCMNGETEHIPEAERTLEEVDAGIEILAPSWRPSVHGAYPMVPEFLAGAPDCMRVLHDELQDHAPVTVYVASDLSIGVSPSMMLKRGIALLAMVMKLNAERPIKLAMISENMMATGTEEHLQIIDIPTQPLHLATACFALTSNTFAQYLAYPVCSHTGGRVIWPSNYDEGSWRWEAYLRGKGILGPKDLYFKAAYLLDGDQYTNPVPWVNAQIEKFRQLSNEGDN